MIEINNVGTITQIVNKNTLEMVEIYFPNPKLNPNKTTAYYIAGKYWN